MNGIAFDRVSFAYTGRPVLDDVSFDLPEGEFCLLVGPTGAGKSTLLKTVNGLVPHFTGGTISGRITVAGREVHGSTPADLADLVGYVGQEPLAGFVTDEVERELAYTAEQLGIDPAAMRKRVTEIVDLLGLADVRDRDLAALSSGQRQRVAIGAALVAGPAALVLDEPTSALDPVGRVDVRGMVRAAADRGAAVFLNSHLLSEVEQVCDRVAIIDHGRVVALGDLDDVLGVAETQVRVTGISAADLPAFERFGPPMIEGDVLRIRPMAAGEVPDLVSTLVAMGAKIHEVRSGRTSLEQRFLALVAQDRPPAGAPSAQRMLGER
jgi:energy-coupling factor transport system ATP-binding protein